MSGERRLRVYRLASTSRLEGGIVGALERLQLVGEGTLDDVLFVGRSAETGELAALDLHTGTRDGTSRAMLDFRLEPERRRALTERTLAGRPGAVPPSAIEAIGDGLTAGEALVAVLVAGPVPALDDAIARSDGRLVLDEPVDARALADVASRLVSCVSASP